MPEPSKYGKALNALKQAGQPAHTPAAPQPEPTVKAGRGGKRSDPGYSPTTFFVRKDTKRKAARLLEDMDSEQDLSDLVQQLLAQWVTEHSHA
jgi:hypothetical protein